MADYRNDESQRDCCQWRGVRCHNRTNRVTRLDLGKYQSLDHHLGAPLRGKINTSLLELQHLRCLDLSFNDFEYAPIPEFIGSLSKLQYQNLASANFNGPIPQRLGNPSKLLYLDLHDDFDCYSENLDWLSSLRSLEYLDLSYTNLSMAHNWLQAVSKLNSMKELHVRCGALPEIPLSLLPKINGSAPLVVLDLHWNWYLSTHLPLIHWFSNFSTGLTSINLNGDGMPGPIPNVFKNMISLEYLDLCVNRLEGGIPKYFGNMNSLRGLYLGDNNLIGEFWELMMNFSGPMEKKLRHLDLSGNSISGLFSNMSRFSSLLELKLRENQLNGSIQVGYLQLPSLVFLDLSSNQFTGPVPDLSSLSSLKQLSLDNNMFNGTLTESIGRLSKLEVLWIGSNLVEGIITEPHLFNLSRLQILDLSLNSFLEIKFSPRWIPLFQLEYLNLRQCKLGKYFSTWLKTQKELVYIDIPSTGISDVMPSWFGGLAPTLLYMNTSHNEMYGSFPNFPFSVINFRGSLLPHFRPSGMILDLSSNKISGSVTFLCQSKEWELLDLSDNLFSDVIPDCFANFQKLKYLNLANNHLSGEIPNSFGLLSALSLLHLRNNSISGRVPVSMRNCTSLKMIDVGENRLTGRIPTWMGDSFQS
ncbi:hypothetical protein Salat_2477500 [Sesamum alatum]|uniref:Leucine-rich repeat-containing N-terminal plant-type domain-containing protein n=1 Tax=Sesamum alatum TaxID=300844 RepID=A0AAE1XR56_9LAMI|nr:hypothetical protein Salat_2477500 [Sesamum alatum]